MADLFQLENEDVGALLDELADSSDLVTRRLVHRSSNPIDWRAAIRPTPALVERIMGNGQVHAAPPGSFLVPTYAGLDTLVFSDSIRRRLQEFSALVRVKNGTGDSTTPGGPVALFAGPSGVGKSAAAAAVAHDLQWPMFRVDLASLVSKYIGETEENISRLLESASGRRLVLHFEEAESLFGKRGEIREARDRYANLEVSHLLALIETHNGPCILSTNLRANVDRAFLRRFQVVVEFARPDRQQRAEIWKGLSGDRFDDDDLVMLASPELTGGDIRNAVYFADSLLVACKGGARTPIDESLRGLCNDLKDVSPLGFAALAIWRELGKDGRYVAPTDLGGLADHFPAALAKAEGFAS